MNDLQTFFILQIRIEKLWNKLRPICCENIVIVFNTTRFLQKSSDCYVGNFPPPNLSVKASEVY